MESFGTRLAELRKERNLTQNDIADQLNLSPQAVSRWENDLTSPDIDTLVSLAEILNITTDELLGKKKTGTLYLPSEERKDINNMMLKVVCDTADGDRIRANLPMAAIRVFVNNDSQIFSGNKALEGIDLNQIYRMAEEGMIGELVCVDSAEGDHVTVIVE